MQRETIQKVQDIYGVFKYQCLGVIKTGFRLGASPQTAIARKPLRWTVSAEKQNGS
ncbi:hypothetical protein DPMN_120482 [Dreissena polymorpha]|uniref:Uncharacterized protein n=1 Tax=Dreissena polymorpha TaxID=45954 RepID=A0A9D4GNQ8_DREPO|nr:hypothetical protein DPMN_120482 [Dreissena polymorpha]